MRVRWWGARSCLGERPAGSRRIRFKKAIPVRRDRRELRRRLRLAARAEQAEQRVEMTRVLRRLSEQHVPVLRMRPGAEVGKEIVEFRDGTQLLLEVRDGTVAVRRLERGIPRSRAFLERVQPCFGVCWYRLWFLSPSGGKLEEVLARVAPFTDVESETARHRPCSWHRPLGER